MLLYALRDNLKLHGPQGSGYVDASVISGYMHVSGRSIAVQNIGSGLRAGARSQDIGCRECAVVHIKKYALAPGSRRSRG